MKINIPWIISRRRILFAISIDIIINLFFYTKIFNEKFNSYPNPIVVVSLFIFWIIISYVLGRYMICRKISFLEIFISFIKAAFLFIICNFVYLIINWSNKIFLIIFNKEINNYNIQSDQSLFFIKTTLIITLISFLSQYFLSIITNKIYNKKNKIWLFYGSEKGYKIFQAEVYLRFIDYIFERIDLNFQSQEKDINNIEGVIIENNNDIDQSQLDHIFYFKSKGITVINALNWCETKLHRIPPYLIENKYQIFEKFNLLNDSYKIRIKRIGDFLISLFLIIITLPITILISILIYLEDRGPIFYSQIRTGFRGEKIIIYKFRSMVKDAEKNGPQWSIKGDKRITKIGKIIRSTRLDELPQLFSVIEGKMSLIGPRPERPEIEERLLKEIPYYKYRNILKPGISGWAQVNYPYGASIKDTIIKLSYDIYYINHISFLLDFFILFKTIKTVFTARNYKPQI